MIKLLCVHLDKTREGFMTPVPNQIALISISEVWTKSVNHKTGRLGEKPGRGE